MVPPSGMPTEFFALVTYKGKIVDADFVIPGRCPSVFGRGLLASLHISVNSATSSINSIMQSSSVQQDLEVHSPAVSVLGTFPDYQHHITLTADARPTTAKLRPMLWLSATQSWLKSNTCLRVAFGFTSKHMNGNTLW